jgi:hypothetical protein
MPAATLRYKERWPMKKLVVDRVKCVDSTDATGDDLYFLLMRFGDPACNVTRVGPNSAWKDMECGDIRNTDVVLVNDFKGTYLAAVMDEDDSYDFDRELRAELSNALSFLYGIVKKTETDQGRQVGAMMNYFANMIGRKRTNDDLLSVQSISGVGGPMQVIGAGAHYEINLKIV